MNFSLDQEQRAKTRQFLGYFNLENRYILSSNQPIAIPQQGILEQNMRSLLDQTSLDIVVSLINQIECSRCAIEAAKTRLMTSEVAYAVKFNPYELSMRWAEDYKLCEQLAHLLAVPVYWHPTGRGIAPTGSFGNIPLYGGG